MQIELKTVEALAWRIRAAQALATDHSDKVWEQGNTERAMFKLGEAQGLSRAADILFSYVQSMNDNNLEEDE